jgi:succinoglycan biosynthesis protein ExoW
MNEFTEKPLVSIIIPFFQRKKGLLIKCVSSILEQKDFDNFQVIIVDDGFHVSASDELLLVLQQTEKVTVILQENSGPGAARNRGLDNMPTNTKYVAFIDSDDWWEETFLSTAVTALEKGYELFFGNSQRFGYDESRFDWKAGKDLNLVSEEHNLIETEKSLYEFKGSFFDYALVRSNIISTSAMVYRLDSHSQLRFSTKLFNGQDRLFKLALSQVISKVAFCPKILVQEEEGINIYDSAKWGTAKSLILISNYIKLSKAILLEIELDDRRRRMVMKRLNDSRYSFVASLLHLIKSGVDFDWAVVRSTLKADPGSLIQVIPNVLRVVFKVGR